MGGFQAPTRLPPPCSGAAFAASSLEWLARYLRPLRSCSPPTYRGLNGHWRQSPAVPIASSFLWDTPVKVERVCHEMTALPPARHRELVVDGLPYFTGDWGDHSP